MAGEMDKIKGRAKQAAGDITDDPDLKAEGEVDEATGKIKDAGDKMVDTARDAVKGKAD